MKKTLKVLMAIALFAVVLSIATGVSAKTFTSFVDDKIFVPGGEVGGIKNYTITSDATLKAEVASNTIEVTTGAVELDLAAGDTLAKDITIEKGAKLVISGTGAVSAKIINKGTLVLQDSLNVAGMVVTNAGRVEIRNKNNVSTAHPTLDANAIVMTASTAEVISVYPVPSMVKGETAAVEAKLGYYIFENKADNKTIYVVTPVIPFEAYVVNSTGDKVTTFEEDMVYEVVIKANYTFDGKTYEMKPWLPMLKGSSLSDEDFAKIDTTPSVTNADGTTTLKFKIHKDLVGKQFTLDVALNAADGKTYDYTTKKVGANGAVVPTTEPTATAEPTNTPTPAPTEAPNKGDKDETPKTGDSIIPATAVLAVVVIANVVYFAKSKRS